MFSYACLSLGLILAQLGQHKHELLHYILLILSLSIFCLIRFNLLKLPSSSSKKYYLIAIALFIVGYSYANLRIIYRLNSLFSVSLNHLQITGYLISPPTKRPNGMQANFGIISGTFANKNVLLNYPESMELSPGHNYTLEASIQPLNIPHNTASFDYQQYLVSQNIAGFAYAKTLLVDHGQSYAPAGLINQIRVNMINYLSTTLANQEYLGLVVALVTGYQQLIPDQQWQTFKNSGIAHIVSISGLHITLVTGICIFLASFLYQLLPFNHVPKQVFLAWIGVSSALAYALLSGFSIPTQRAFYLILIMGYLSTARRHIPLLQKLSMTLSLVLIIEPFATVSSGFWLSFGLVAAIFYVNSLYSYEKSKLKLWLLLQLAITMVGLPIGLYLFKTYPLVSVVANLWAIPVLGNIITPIILLTSILHLSWLLNIITELLHYLMLPIVYLAKIKPYWQTTPGLAALAISYLGIFLLLLPSSIRGKNLVGITLFASLFAIPNNTVLSYGQMQIVTFANKKIGISLIQSWQHNILVLISANSESQTTLLRYTLLPYLQTEHITHLDYILTNTRLESGVMDLFKSNQISLGIINPNDEINLDGIKINYYRRNQHLALEIITKFKHAYIGDGYYPFQDTKWDNIIIAYLQGNLEWIFANPTLNLILNYPTSTKGKIDELTENLNLSIDNIYDLTKIGSVILTPDQVRIQNVYSTE